MTDEDFSTYLAFDFGLRRIGVAVGQAVNKTARPLTTVLAIEGEPQWHEIKKIINEWRPKALIVGLPFHMDGQSGQLHEQVTIFSQHLKMQSGLPVFLVDERLTTAAARERIESAGLKVMRHKCIDGMAAAIILEQWLTQPTIGEQE